MRCSSDVLVSIIIPTYNCIHWLGEAIDSALTQTYVNCEVIVIDDGSTDGTGEWVNRRYGNRVCYFRQENLGRGAARNRGLEMARGDYIQFLDADDILASHKVATHINFLKARPEYGAVYGHCQVFYDDDRQNTWDWPGQANYASGNILAQEIHHPFLLTIMVLVRREWIDYVGGFDVKLRSNEDWDLWLRIAMAGAKFHFLPGDVVAWYRRRSNETAKASVHLESGVIILRQLASHLDSREERNHLLIGTAIGRWQASYGRALIQEGQRFRGIGELVRSLGHNQADLWRKITHILLYAILTPQQTQWLRRRYL